MIRKLTPRTPINLMLCALIIPFVLVGAQAQTPTPTPPSEEQQELQRRRDLLNLQKEIAESEKAIAEAEKAKREAKFPKSDAKPLEGKTTVDGAVIESQMVAYVSMARAANTLVLALSKHPGNVNNLAIFNEADVKLLLSYKVADKQLEMLRDRYLHLLAEPVTAICSPKPSPSPAPSPSPRSKSIDLFSIAESFLGAFVDMTALLRTDVEIKGQSFDIDEAPLVSEVFRAARCRYGNGINLYYPAVFPPDTDAQRKYEILGKLERLRCLRDAAGKLISAIDKNQKDLDDAEAGGKGIEAALKQNQTAQDNARSELRRILRAHCRRASQNNQILDEQLLTWGLGGWLSRYCPGLAGDQRERLLGVADSLAQLEKESVKLKGKKEDAKEEAAGLEKTQAELWKLLRTSVTDQGTPEDVATQLKSLNEQFDKLIASFIQTESASNINLLTLFIKAENLNYALPAATSYWLQLKVIKAGGNNRIKTNLIWDIFTGGNRVSHSGGVIVEYVLYDTSGRAIASDTLTDYTDYIKASKIRRLANPSVDDLGCPCDKPECQVEKKR